MLVREIMHSPVITAEETAALSAAYRLMQANQIRHLPVVTGDSLVGVVTDRDLRLATSQLSENPFSADARVGEIMTRNVVTAGPLDPIEESARTMRELMIGCLPVLEDDRLVGIITGPDLLDALVRLTGLSRPSSRLAVQLPGEQGDFSRMMAILEQHGVDVLSVLSYPDAQEHPHVILRVSTINMQAIVGTLCRSGFNVQWPPAKAWCR